MTEDKQLQGSVSSATCSHGRASWPGLEMSGRISDKMPSEQSLKEVSQLTRGKESMRQREW